MFVHTRPVRDQIGIVDILFKINITEHPEFKIAHSGQVLWVDGTIDYADNTMIYINCKTIRWEHDDPV
jgi:hypothetical protein